jgi:hypothetical protein
MKGFISRREYKLIVARLNKGKKIGSRQGNWTNGTPPYPYEYERYKNKHNPKGLVVNDEKLKIYRYIIESVINNSKTPKQIAVELNNMNVPSPKNGVWHGNTVYRLLLDETHLGKIIANKTKGDAHKKKKVNAKPVVNIPKEKWVIVQNCHEAVKTQDEHEKILLFANRLTKTPKRTQNTIMPLSGLIKCAKCGHTMGVYRRADRNMTEVLKTCWYSDTLGNKCNNSGMQLNFLYDFLRQDMLSYLNRLKEQLSNLYINDNKSLLEKKIMELKNEINSKQKTLERMLDGFENGVYSLDQYKERKNKVDNTISKLDQECAIYEMRFNKYNVLDIQNKLDRVQYVYDNVTSKNIGDEEKNKLHKSIIDYIRWERNGVVIKIEVEYI